MKVKWFGSHWSEANFISLTPIVETGNIRWYLVYADKDGNVYYFITEDINDIIIYE